MLNRLLRSGKILLCLCVTFVSVKIFAWSLAQRSSVLKQVSEDLALSSYSSRPVDRYPCDKGSRNIQDVEMVKRNDWMSFQ